MSASCIAYHPEPQPLLLSTLQDGRPQGHLAYCISDTVDSLNLGAFHARYAKGGPRNQPFQLAMRVKVLVHAYGTGVFSSRKIGREGRGREQAKFQTDKGKGDYRKRKWMA